MIAVVLTIVAAIFFGLSSVMEQRSTKQVRQRAALSPRLLVDLGRRVPWLATCLASQRPAERPLASSAVNPADMSGGVAR